MASSGGADSRSTPKRSARVGATAARRPGPDLDLDLDRASRGEASMGRELQPRRATAPHLQRVISHHLIGHVRLAATMLVAFSRQDLKREGRREREEREEEGGRRGGSGGRGVWGRRRCRIRSARRRGVGGGWLSAFGSERHGSLHALNCRNQVKLDILACNYFQIYIYL